MNKIEQAQHWANNIGYYSANRPTERAALKLWRCGYVNLRNYFGRYGFLMHHLPLRTRITELEEELSLPTRAYGQKCNDCRRRRPLTTDYWCRDAGRKSGYKAICKICDKRKRQKAS